jgi:inner membrane protein
MASTWTHAIVAIAVAAAIVPRTTHKRVWLGVAVAAALPDLDAIWRPFGGPDVAWLGGHRAFTHSITFAAVAGLLLVPVLRGSTRGASANAVLWLGLSLAIVSHGVLDSLTGYGEGIQFLSPWSSVRYRAPWQLLGHGIVRDTIAFGLFYLVAHATIRLRGLPMPRFLNPAFLRATA